VLVVAGITGYGFRFRKVVELRRGVPEERWMIDRRIFLSLVLGSRVWAEGSRTVEEKWADELKRFAEADRKTPPKSGQIVFAGSSSIRLWKLEQSFPDLGVVNRGFGGSTIPENEALADRLILPLKPKAIVFYAGDNDLAAKGAEAGKTVEDFRKFLAALERGGLLVPFVYIAIKPSISRWKLRSMQQVANRAIAAICAERKETMRFVDLDRVMLGSGGEPDPALFEKDGLHVNAAGYERWTPLVRQALRELLPGEIP
jgi:lysophospholipase L1-like esterase